MILSMQEIREKVLPICMKYNIQRLSLFGSYARGEATEESDVDLHIELDRGTTLLALGGIYTELEKALRKKVDIVTQIPEEQEIFRKYIERDEVPLYENQRERRTNPSKYRKAL